MKSLIGFALTLTLVSCGKAGKLPTANSQYNPLVPGDSKYQSLVGHWVEVRGCVDMDPERPNGLKKRMEARFYDWNSRPALLDSRDVKIGEVIFSGSCVRENVVKLPELMSYYRSTSQGLEFSPDDLSFFAPVPFMQISPEEILFQGQHFKRLSADPVAL